MVKALELTGEDQDLSEIFKEGLMVVDEELPEPVMNRSCLNRSKIYRRESNIKKSKYVVVRE